MRSETPTIRRLGGALAGAAVLSIGLAPASAAAPSPRPEPPARTAPAASSTQGSPRPLLTAAGVPPLFEMALDETHGLLYGSDAAGGKIWVLSLSTLATVATIDVGMAAQPSGIDLSPDGATLAVARPGFGNIALIDTASRTITGTLFPVLATATAPYDLRFGRAGRLYSVGSSGADEVHVFDMTSKTEVGHSSLFSVGVPRIAITGDNNSLYVTDSGFTTPTLTRYSISTDTPTVSASAPFNAVQPGTMALRPDGSAVYMSSGQVWSGDLTHLLGTVFNNNGNVAYAPATDRLYLTGGAALFRCDGTTFKFLSTRVTSGTFVSSLRINAADTVAFASTDAGLDAVLLTTPASPGVFALAGLGSATVSWTPPTDTGSGPITGYTIVSSSGGQATAPATATSAVLAGLVAGPHTFTVTASNAVGPGSSSGPSNSVVVLDGATYHPLTPARILDTRTGTGGVPVAPIGPSGTLNVQVSGRGGVPTADVSAVFLNVTVTDTTASSFLSIWPTGLAQPTVSNLNWTPGLTVPNLVEVALGNNGQVSIFNHAGSVDVVFDVAGWVGDAFNSFGRDGMFNSLQPARLEDTRLDGRTIGAGGTLTLPVAGHGGVPASGTSAVVLNVTVTNPTAQGFLTVWPAGATQPLASNLNFVPGQTVPNRVVVKLGTGGAISIFNGFGSADVVVDVDGWFTDATSTAGGSGLVATVPGRFFDTRGTTGPLPAGGVLGLQVNPTDSRRMTALMLNVTATDATASSFLTVWPDGALQPLASDLNFVAGQTVPNLTIAGLSSARAFDIFNQQGSVDVVVDVFGFYGGLAPAPPAAAVALPAAGEAGPAPLNKRPAAGAPAGARIQATAPAPVRVGGTRT